MLEVISRGVGEFKPPDPDGFRAHVRDHKERREKEGDEFRDQISEGGECLAHAGYPFRSRRGNLSASMHTLFRNMPVFSS